MNQITRLILAALAAGATVHAQTSTKCNPTTNDCPADKALSKAIEYDFTKGAPEDFTVADGTKPKFTSEGAEFTIAKRGDAPTMFSNWYIMFGHTEVTLKVAGGTGLVSSLVLLSDDLDEIDWEWLGGKSEEVQTNYFGQGKTTDYTRGGTSPNPGAQSEFHTYAVDWTAEHIQWSIDGKVVRTLTPDTAVKGQYPQTPMKFSIGNWVAGDDGQPQGTIEWAGGKIDYTKGPYTMTVKKVKVQDYSTGDEYSYGDKTGTWQSIKSKNGKINSSGTPSDTVSTAKAEGTAISSTAGPEATHAAVANNPAAGNGTANGTISGTPAQTTGSAGSGSGSSSNGAAATGQGAPQTGAAARVGAGVGAMALAAAVMIL